MELPTWNILRKDRGNQKKTIYKGTCKRPPLLNPFIYYITQQKVNQNFI